MDKLRIGCPFVSHFYACKLLKILYLFASLRSVVLKETVMRDRKNKTLPRQLRPIIET